MLTDYITNVGPLKLKVQIIFALFQSSRIYTVCFLLRMRPKSFPGFFQLTQ